jgi:hypothetical protein
VSTAVVALDARERLAPLMARFREFRQPDLESLSAVVAGLAASEGRRHRSDLGFHYAWYVGPSLGREDREILDELFSDMSVALATGVTGIDVARFGGRVPVASPRRAGALAGWLLPPSRERRLQDVALAMLDEACHPFDPRLAVVGCWNVVCSQVFRGAVPGSVVDRLEAAWRQAFGDVPA